MEINDLYSIEDTRVFAVTDGTARLSTELGRYLFRPSMGSTILLSENSTKPCISRNYEKEL